MRGRKDHTWRVMVLVCVIGFSGFLVSCGGGEQPTPIPPPPLPPPVEFDYEETPTPTPMPETPTPLPPTPTPTSCPTPASQLGKVAYITLDDGPDYAGITQDTLDLLQQPRNQGIKVTYFLHSARMTGNEGTVQQMRNDGHRIANHSPDQDVWFNALGNQQTMSDVIDETENAIRTALNDPTFVTGIFRSPGGTLQYGTHESDQIPGHPDWYHYGWHVDTEDWKRDAQSSIEHTMEQIDNGFGGDRPIILMHSIHPQNPKILQGIIDGLRDRGFTRFGTLPRPGDSPGVLYP